MNRLAAAAVGAALVVAAWGVALVTPSEDDAVIPFTVQGLLGEEASGRNLAVTVTDVRRAASVSTEEWTADGNWVVVDIEAHAIEEEVGASLVLATVQIDGVTYRASERPDSILETRLAVDIPRIGSLAFELPASLAAGDAVLRLALRTDTRLDSVLEFPLDLDDVDVETDAELIATGWSNP